MISKFEKVANPTNLLSVVEDRLPTSGFILNQLKCHDKFLDDLEIFGFQYGEEKNTWILTKFYRPDWGVLISISAPPDPGVIPECVKEAFKSSDLIEWHKPFLFNSLEHHVFKLIMDLNIETLGRTVTTYPCTFFYMEPEKALELEPTFNYPADVAVEVRRLDTSKGTPFIADNWKYAKDTTRIMVKKCIERMPSMGIYVKGELVCGAVTPGFGLISMLHTDPAHRRKGYASVCMRHLFKEVAKEGLYPCLTSELENKVAVNFQRSLGLKSTKTPLMFIGCQLPL